MAKIPVYQITVPEYHVKSPPDHTSIGSRIDKVIKKHFLGKRVAIRCLGSQEHKGKSVDDMVKIIKKTGIDRYDPKRIGDRYENVEGKHIDFFALDFTVKQNSRIMEKFIEPFYTWPPQLGGKPVRLDIAIVYDLSKLKRVIHTYEGRDDIKKDGFVFRNPENKRDALLGIIKII
ncbi:hypothetical protein KY349_05245 [Candidatus Woesearchaeota archaeon]|nr:hypothetical protein [Candidatus Woesearchaeota archaeon]